MKNKNKKQKMIPQYSLNKNKGLSFNTPKSFRPLSLANFKYNTISNYNINSLKNNIKNKMIFLSLKSTNQTSDSFRNSKENTNSLNSYKSLSPYSFSSILNRKKNRKNEKLSLTIDQQNKLYSIIKNFKDNKIITMELYKLDKNFPLNSITRSNFHFLSKENFKNSSKKSKIKQKQEMNKIFLTSSNMIELFNVKTRKILDNTIKNTKFSRNINEFRKQIINSYLDYEKRRNEIKKKKIYYNEALNKFEECDEKRIKDAEKLEENFYIKKSSILSKDNIIYPYIKNINNSKPKSKINIDDDTENEVQYFKTNLFHNNSNYSNSISNKILKTVQSEKIFSERKKSFEKYLKKKLKNKAKIFADSLYGIKDFPTKVLRKKNASYLLNFNINNLRRIVKVNSIKKNSYSIEDDDLLIKNLKKLREEIRKTENDFYTVFKGKKNYKLIFLKDKVKPSTLQKLKIMKNSHFGLPC